jgi:hypothetical protein
MAAQHWSSPMVQNLSPSPLAAKRWWLRPAVPNPCQSTVAAGQAKAAEQAKFDMLHCRATKN